MGMETCAVERWPNIPMDTHPRTEHRSNRLTTTEYETPVLSVETVRLLAVSIYLRRSTLPSSRYSD